MNRATMVFTPPSYSEFTQAEMRATRKLYVRWKREHDIKGGDFTLALDRLLNLHGHSMTDVAYFLGVSRQRVSQYVQRGGITVKYFGAQHRVWDEGEMRFIPIGGKDEYTKWVRARHGAWAKVRRARLMRARIAIWVVRDMAEDLGRVPGHIDLADAWCVGPPQLNSMFWSSAKDTGYSVLWQELWADAGFEYPRHARRGRGRQKRRETFCQCETCEEHRRAVELAKLPVPHRWTRRGPTPQPGA